MSAPGPDSRIYGIPERTKGSDFDQKKTSQWLRRNALKAKTKWLIFAAQDYSLNMTMNKQQSLETK